MASEYSVYITSPVYDMEYNGETYPVRNVIIAYKGAGLYTTRDFAHSLIEDFGKTPDYRAEMLDQMIDGYVETREELENLEELLY